jgi:hypothetical protein
VAVTVSPERTHDDGMRMEDDGPLFPAACIALSDSTEIGRLMVAGGTSGTAVVGVGGSVVGGSVVGGSVVAGSVVAGDGMDVDVDTVLDEWCRCTWLRPASPRATRSRTTHAAKTSSLGSARLEFRRTPEVPMSSVPELFEMSLAKLMEELAVVVTRGPAG